MDFVAEDVFEYLKIINWDEVVEYDAVEYAADPDGIFHCRTSCGASQGCIIPDEENYVIKFPLDGEYHHRYYDDDFDSTEEYEEYYNNDENKELIEFCGADDGGDGSNYSEAALLVYEDAVVAGLGKLFAEMKYFGIHKGHKIYLQEKCTLWAAERDSDTHSTTPEERSSAQDVMDTADGYCEFDDRFAALMIKTYGETAFRDFLRFLDDHGVNDLHDSNVGFRLDGTPCLIDYASYNEQDED